MLDQSRRTQRYRCVMVSNEGAPSAAIIRLASQYGRYGYRRITALLRAEGRHVNHKRVERIWRREVLRVPSRQPKRGRLWLNDGSCIRLRPRRNHVWAFDLVQARTHDGRSFRMLTVIDAFTRESLAIEIAHRLRSDDVLAPVLNAALSYCVAPSNRGQLITSCSRSLASVGKATFLGCTVVSTVPTGG